MESSYRIIKGNHIDYSNDDRFLIDTDLQPIEEDGDLFDQESLLDPNIDSQDRAKVMADLEEYKKRMYMEMEYEKKNILEGALIQAEKEAVKIRAAAQEEGYREGYTKAIDGAKAEAEEIKANALHILEQVKDYRDKYLRDNESNIYSLAGAMAENIIHYSIDEDDANIIKLIQPLLEEYLKEEDITITTTKRGKDLLVKHQASLQDLCPNTRFIFLVDKSMGKNGFVIENKESIVDLNIGVQLENMIKAISDLDD